MKTMNWQDKFRIYTLLLLMVLGIVPSLQWHQVIKQRAKLNADIKAFNADVNAKLAQIKELQKHTVELQKQTGQLSGCLAGPKPEIGGPHCHAVTVKKTNGGCAQHDGAFSCHYDFLQPQTWGRCLMEVDNSLDCEKGGVLSHYEDGAAIPAWNLEAKSCPLLKDQIAKFGQDPTMTMPVTIEMPHKEAPKT
jgi:hypothetical protein